MKKLIGWWGVSTLAALAAGSPAQAGEPCAKIKGAAPNTWVKIDEAVTGNRGSPGFVYMPDSGKFLLFGGTMKKEPRMYEDMAFDPATGKWENLCTPGKPWAKKTGPVKFPTHGTEYFRIGDKQGNPRMNTYSGWSSMCFFQFAYDTDARKLYAHMRGNTVAFNPASPAWKYLKPAGGPGSVKWSAMCYVPTTKEILFFGGTTTLRACGTWSYKPGANTWTRVAPAGKLTPPLSARVEPRRIAAHDHLAALRNRYFVVERPENSKRDLAAAARELAGKVRTLSGVVEKAKGQADAYEKQQLAWALAELASAKAALGKAGSANAAGIAAARSAKDHLRRAKWSLNVEPPSRAHSPLVWDAARERVLLFGGDADQMCLADTWAYDPAKRRWTELRPARSPSPRAGHALVYLPESRTVALVGHSYQLAGQGYRQLDSEIWTYNAAKNTWNFIRSFKPGDRRKKTPPEAPPHVMGRSGYTTAAAMPGDVVVCVGRGGNTWSVTPSTWAIKVDPSRVDAADTAKLAVAPGAEGTRVGDQSGTDPAWFDGGPAPEPGWDKKLTAIPANRWFEAKPPLRPRRSDYGSVMYDPHGDQFLLWAGGHSAYCGNDVAHWSLRTNRWSTAQRPSIPREYNHSNGGGGGGRDLMGVPKMCQHPYRWYAYDPRLKKLIYVPGPATYVYDPVTRRWESKNYANRRTGEQFMMIATPHGAVALARGGDRIGKLWKFTGKGDGWVELKQTGGNLGYPYCDGHSLVYDSKRDRLIRVQPERGQAKCTVKTYDFKTGEVKVLNVAGSDKTNAGHREAVYLEHCDAVLTLSRKGPVKFHYLDIAGDRWRLVEIPPDFGKGYSRRWSTGSGWAYDAQRKLVLANLCHAQPLVLRLDPKTAKFEDVK